jgi:hypothetical protein
MKPLSRYLIPLAIVAIAPVAWSSAIFDASIDTSSLVGSGPFSIDFQFIDGTGLPGDLNNNTVSVSNFTFGAGGAPIGSPSFLDGASGDLSGSVLLTDAQFFNEFTQSFTPGSLLSFQVQITTNLNLSGVPDEFSFAILDSTGTELPTTGPASEFFSLTIDSSNPSLLIYGSSPGADFAVPSPVVTQESSVPEPGFLGTAGVVLLLAAAGIRERGDSVAHFKSGAFDINRLVSPCKPDDSE